MHSSEDRRCTVQRIGGAHTSVRFMIGVEHDLQIATKTIFTCDLKPLYDTSATKGSLVHSNVM